MDRLEAMHVFVTVADLRGFAPAARKLRLSPSAVTRMIAALEEHLGARLLQRTTRQVRLTDVGTRYLERARRILADVEEADGSAREERNRPSGRLVVSAPVGFGRLHVGPVMTAYLKRYPDVAAELRLSDNFVNLVEDAVDAAVRIGHLADSSLVARHIGSAALITCATPGYLKLFGVPAYPDELKNGHRLVSYVSSQNGRAVPFRFEHKGEKTEIKVEHRVGVNESNAHLAAGLAGLGIIQTFSYAAGAALREGALVEILKKWRPAPYPFHVVYPQNRHVTHRLRVFMDWLVECFPEKVGVN